METHLSLLDCKVRLQYLPSSLIRALQIYVCRSCDKAFGNKLEYVTHKNTHKNQTDTANSVFIELPDGHLHTQPFQCTLCEKTFQQNAQLIAHDLLHRSQPTLPCSHCSKVFATRREFNQHLREFNLPFLCDQCPKTFKSQKYLTLHKNRHNPERKRYQCKFCGKDFQLKHYLQLHLNRHTRQNLHICQHCGLECISEYALKSHIIRHTKKSEFMCNVCKFVGVSQSELREHTNRHHNKKLSFACDICDKKFPEQRNLKVHRRIHQNVREFKCNFCDYAAVQSGPLRKHILSKHTNEFHYSCTLCSKNFKCRAELTSHMQVHTAEKPHKCNQCNATFKWQYTLKRHMEIHQESKNYKCEQCGKMFTYKNSLKLHLLTHSGILPYKCDICERCFKQSSVLKQHISTVHLDGNPLQCKTCSKPFDKYVEFEAHVRKHRSDKNFGKKYKCDQCGRRFKLKENLLLHKPKHVATPKYYTCEICKVSLKSKPGLAKHMVAHRNERSWKCERSQCYKSFNTRKELLMHQLSKMCMSQIVE